MTLEETINKAFPYRSCPQDRANDNTRKKWLLKEIIKYIEDNYEPVNDRGTFGEVRGKDVLPGVQS